MIWPEILSISSLSIFSLILTAVLFLIGYPIVRRLYWLKDADFSEKLCLGLFFGMIVLVFVSSLVSLIGSFLFLIFIVLPSIGFMLVIWDYKKIQKIKLSVTNFSKYLPLFLIIILVAFLSFKAVSGLVGSTDADEAYHTFVINAFITNGRVVDRPIPLYQFLFYQPPGPHIIGAFAVSVAAYPIEKISISLSAFYTILTSIGIYALAKNLFKSTLIAVIASLLALFAWNFWHPLSFTFTVPIMTFSICTGILLINRTFNSRLSILKKSILLSAVTAFSFFILPGLPIYLFSFSLAYICIKVISWRPKRAQLPSIVGGCFLFGALSMFLSYPYLAVIAEFLKNSTTGLPPDWILPTLRSTFVPSASNSYYAPSLFVNIFSLSNYAASQGALLYIGPLSILFVGMFLMTRYMLPNSQNKIDPITHAKWFTLAKITAIFFLQFELLFIFAKIANVVYFPSILGLPTFPISYLADPLRTAEALYLPLTILTCSTISFVIALPSFFLCPKEDKKMVRFKMSMKTLGFRKKVVVTFRGFRKSLIGKSLISLVVCLILLSQIVNSFQIGVEGYVQAPMQPYDIPSKQVTQFSLLAADDLSTFQWIDANTNKNDVFLVSQIDAGQYLTSVTGRLSIFPFGPSEGSRHYRLLQFALEIDPSDPYILTILAYYNITYVFIGSKSYDPTAPTWAAPYAQNAVFNASKLLSSQFFIPIANFGNSWLFKVNYHNSFITQGPCVTALSDSAVIFQNSSLGSWEIRQGTQMRSSLQNYVTVNLNTSLWALFHFNSFMDLTNINDIALYAKSSANQEYRLFLYDQANNYEYWNFNASNSWSIILLDLSTPNGESKQSFSKDQVSRIEINTALSTDHEGLVFDFDPIFLVKNIVTTELSEQYSSQFVMPKLSLSLPNPGNYTLLVPSFLKYNDDNFLPAGSFQVLPNSDLLFDCVSDQTGSIFEFASSDPQTLLTSFVSRPLRDIGFQRFNSWSNASLSIQNDFGPIGTSILSTNMYKPWDLVIFKLNNINLSNGTLELGLFVNGTNLGENNGYVRIYKTHADATSHSNAIAEFPVQRTQCWILFSTPLANVASLYINVENLDTIGQYILEPLVYSSNPYY